MNTDNLREQINKLGQEHGYFWVMPDRYEGDEDEATREAFIDQLMHLIEQSQETLKKQARDELLDELSYYNGAYIHDCGRRVDGVIHQSVINDKRAEA